MDENEIINENILINEENTITNLTIDITNEIILNNEKLLEMQEQNNLYCSSILFVLCLAFLLFFIHEMMDLK